MLRHLRTHPTPPRHRNRTPNLHRRTHRQALHTLPPTRLHHHTKKGASRMNLVYSLGKHWCASCQINIEAGNEKTDSYGKIRCPNCNQQLRTHSRQYKETSPTVIERRALKTLKLEASRIIFEMHQK